MGNPIYTAVLFDLDGTLYDRDALVRAIAEVQYDTHASALPSMARETYIQRIIEMDDHGMADKQAGYGSLVRGWGLTPGFGEPLLEHFWAEYDRRCQLPDDTRETLVTLRSASADRPS